MKRSTCFLVAGIALLAHARGFSVPLLADDYNFGTMLSGRDSLLQTALRVITSPFGGESGAYYRPLILLSLLWDSFWFDTNPFGYRLTSALLHAANSVVVCALCARLLRPRSAWAIALPGIAFAVHPAAVEVVCWTAARGDPLCVFFYLASLVVLLRYVENPRPLLLVMFGALAFASLLSMESGITLFPVAAILLGRRHANAYAALALVGAAYLGIRFAILGQLGPPKNLPVHLSVSSVVEALRVCVAGIRAGEVPILAWLAPISMLVAVIVNRPHLHPGVVKLLVFFLATVAVSSTLQVFSFDATNSRYVYLACAPLMCLVLGACGARKRWLAGIPVIAVLFIATVRETSVWIRAGHDLLAYTSAVSRSVAKDRWAIVYGTPARTDRGGFVLIDGYGFVFREPFYGPDLSRVVNVPTFRPISRYLTEQVVSHGGEAWRWNPATEELVRLAAPGGTRPTWLADGWRRFSSHFPLRADRDKTMVTMVSSLGAAEFATVRVDDGRYALEEGGLSMLERLAELTPGGMVLVIIGNEPSDAYEFRLPGRDQPHNTGDN